jgi:hypothetical protein
MGKILAGEAFAKVTRQGSVVDGLGRAVEIRDYVSCAFTLKNGR